LIVEGKTGGFLGIGNPELNLHLTFTCHDCIDWMVWMLHGLVLANIREFHQQETRIWASLEEKIK